MILVVYILFVVPEVVNPPEITMVGVIEELFLSFRVTPPWWWIRGMGNDTDKGTKAED